ncbi:MAG: TldD/PmbA family protein [Candidatus Omnitrophota bacterium]
MQPKNQSQLLDDDILKKAIAILMRKGADFGDVFLETASYKSLRIENRKISTSTFREQGAGFRTIKNGKTCYVYTSNLNPRDIISTAHLTANAAMFGTHTPSNSTTPSMQSLTPIPDSLSPDLETMPFPLEELAIKMNTLSDHAWSSDERILQVILFYRESRRHLTLISSTGSWIHHHPSLTEMHAIIMMKDKNGELQTGYEGKSAHSKQHFFRDAHSFETIVDTAVRRAQLLMDATACPHGTFPVVLGPGMNGMIFHESCGHGLEADLAFNGSCFKDMLGKAIASPKITLIDDPTLPQMPGSYPFDDDGVPSQRTVLINEGILENYLCDLNWGKKLNLPATGNGRRQSFRFAPLPRMSNTFIDKGTDSPESIIANTRKGIYVTEAGAGQVDPITGNFMMTITEGYLIENGKVTRPIKGGSLSGTGTQILNAIDRVGNDLVITPTGARCSKTQLIPVSVGMPTIRVSDMLVGGNGESW